LISYIFAVLASDPISVAVNQILYAVHDLSQQRVYSIEIGYIEGERVIKINFGFM